MTNCAMQVLFQPGTDVIEDMALFYGGIGDTTVSARNSCQQLRGRYVAGTGFPIALVQEKEQIIFDFLPFAKQDWELQW